ncbi:MAG TPA: glycine zipper domain-containing protein [Pirellulales bacterium]|nr:glycine zipper domain-containing protein [Pirellulales bacterium]
MFRTGSGLWFLAPLFSMTLAGCASPFYTDRGALVGGLGGAGVGAAVGEAVGHPGVGALVGAGVGTVTGAAIGSGLDQAQARNQAMIASQMGRPIAPGAVTINDVIAMSRSQLDEDLIVNQIRANGVARPLAAGDLIVLTQQGVSKRIIEAMQATPSYPGGPPVVRAPGPPAVLVDQRYVGPPYPYPYPYPYPPPPPAYGFGFSYGLGRR